jgi:protein-S-isoprenylcysteine O-methyltransferase Ste14
MSEIESVLGWLGLGIGVAVSAVVLYSQWRGGRRARVQAVGRGSATLRHPLIILPALVVYAVVLVLLWQPIASLPSPVGVTMSVAGFLAMAAGAAFILWARFTMGESHNISSVAGVELFADHRLVTTGPFALVRHPMYLGFAVAVLGALALYRTWAIAFIVVHGLVFVVRARREEQALAARFGDEWAAYRGRVPAVLPWPRPTSDGPSRARGEPPRIESRQSR